MAVHSRTRRFGSDQTKRPVGLPAALNAAAHAQSVMQPVNGAFQLIGHYGSTLTGLGINDHAIGNARSVVGTVSVIVLFSSMET